MSNPINLQLRHPMREAYHRTAIAHSGYSTNEWYRSACNIAAAQRVKGGRPVLPKAFMDPKPVPPKVPTGIIKGSVTIRPTDEERIKWGQAAADAGWPLKTWILLIADMAAGNPSLFSQLEKVNVRK